MPQSLSWKRREGHRPWELGERRPSGLSRSSLESLRNPGSSSTRADGPGWGSPPQHTLLGPNPLM